MDFEKSRYSQNALFISPGEASALPPEMIVATSGYLRRLTPARHLHLRSLRR
jgi:hypothetical protein